MTDLASSTDARSCGCGASLPPDARFCPGCGRAVGADTDATLVRGGPVRAHWFGVAPPALLLLVAVLVAAGAVALFAIGDWAVGLIVGGVAVLLLTAFVEIARRRPAGRLAAFATAALGGARARGRSQVDAFAAQARTSWRVAHVRRELHRLARTRRGLLTSLGETVYAGGDPTAARAELEALDTRAQDLDRELHALAAWTSVSTAAVPEPYPPPDEGDPPTPVITPEPAPPPDEGTPPQPDPVPTPGPAPAPAE